MWGMDGGEREFNIEVIEKRSVSRTVYARNFREAMDKLREEYRYDNEECFESDEVEEAYVEDMNHKYRCFYSRYRDKEENIGSIFPFDRRGNVPEQKGWNAMDPDDETEFYRNDRKFTAERKAKEMYGFFKEIDPNDESGILAHLRRLGVGTDDE